MVNIRGAIDWLRIRKTNYQLTFELRQPANQAVLIDLARYCRANETCVVKGDPDATRVLEGRREAWLRIQQHLQLTPEQLFALYSGNTAALTEDGK